MFEKSAFRDINGEVETMCHRTASLRRFVPYFVREAELTCSPELSPSPPTVAKTHSDDATIELMIRCMGQVWDAALDLAATKVPDPSNPALSEGVVSVALIKKDDALIGRI